MAGKKTADGELFAVVLILLAIAIGALVVLAVGSAIGLGVGLASYAKAFRANVALERAQGI